MDGIGCDNRLHCNRRMLLTDPDEERTAESETNETDNKIQYLDRWYNREGLSEETIEWLNWFNQLSPQGQLAVNFVPWDLNELVNGSHSDAPVTVETDEKADLSSDLEETDPLFVEAKRWAS